MQSGNSRSDLHQILFLNLVVLALIVIVAKHSELWGGIVGLGYVYILVIEGRILIKTTIQAIL